MEGQPAKLQLGSGEELAGVFLTRDTAEQKRPAQICAWFGMNVDELEEREVRPGLGVTGYKGRGDTVNHRPKSWT